ncbi:cell wall-binding repeat-containing protein [Agromyces italicus]|uniref:cell wall-binding repeat-containing protein n=1 Tax=Agromyces italicus TaxID=279572 RepID=UPI0003B6D6BA|nr:cell wall-binding repeat-containing protein [Agromyces italicus]
MKQLAIAVLVGVFAGLAGLSPAQAADAPGHDPGATATEQSVYAEHVAGQSAHAGDPIPGEAAGEADAEARLELDRTLAEASGSATFAPTAATGFTAGNLIADANFSNGNAMSEAAIQSFLVKMGAGCTSSSCLANYRETTQSIDWSYGACADYVGAADESAARIIYKVQKACKLSARVILVMLQKEQSLLTNRAPSAATLAKAMGYGCPDEGTCDPDYAGFFEQVAFASRQLGYYGTEGSSFTYLKVGQSNPIDYHPDDACGRSNVVIANRATAALYYYTPFQPNAAALKNVYGSGDDCSSYGNRNFWRMYTDWFGDPRGGSAMTVARLQGADRYATAAAISKASFPTPGVPVVYVAAGLQFADALAAAPAAAHKGGPLLLSATTSLPASTLDELRRLAPKQIVIVGGTGAIGGSVATALGKVAPTKRIGGTDRYDTSRRIAADAFGAATLVYLATGRDFPDGLSAGAAAGALDVPVVLIDGAARTAGTATVSLLKKLGAAEVRIAGGTGAVSSGAQANLAASFTVKRYAGTDRYSTSAAVNSVFRTTANAYLATGAAFPDALSGAAAAGAAGDPLLLSPQSCVPPVIRTAIYAKGTTAITLLGGMGALGDRVAKLVSC